MKHPTVKTEDCVLLLLGDDGVRAALENGKPVEFPVDDLVPDMDKAQLACSLCGRTTTLYENVSVAGWVSVHGHRMEDDGATVRPTMTNSRGSLDRDVEWDHADHENFACSECNTGRLYEGTYLERLALVVPPKAAGTESQ